MIDTSTTSTSIKDKPVTRWSLVGVWLVIAAYVVYVYVQALPLVFAKTATPDDMPMGNLDQVALAAFGTLIDVFLLLGFALIAVVLFVRRSDDWFAIFISIFLLTFGGRISETINMAAVTPGYETQAGVILALGDICIVLFVLLFPTGTFSPKWIARFIPMLVVTMGGIYLFPNMSFHWGNLSATSYLLITSSWYLFSIIVSGYRYFREAGVHQKQQMRWMMIGTLGPLIWFLLNNLVNILFSEQIHAIMLGATIHEIIVRVSSLIAFMTLPLFIALAISRSKLFDIDLLIHRSLIYGGLTVGLVFLFGVALGIMSLIFRSFGTGEQSMLAVTISAVGAGAFFQPAHRSLKRAVERTIYKINIEYEETTASGGAISHDQPKTDTTLSNYRDLKLIGRGGMASVYRSKDPVTGQRVAVKVLSTNLADDGQFQKRFMREAETISSLNHQNVVRILNYGEEEGTYFIVMEYLNGPNLHRLLKEDGRLTLDRSLVVLKSIASALDYAHQRGFVHRDVKPSNIMLDKSRGDERAVLTDFGIVKIADANTRITASRVLGTFDYIAPEQIQSSEEVDGRADLYALGVMTYQMLTGSVPFVRPNTGALLLAHLSAPPPDICQIVPDVPHEVSYAIQRAMAKRPEERFDTATDFVNAMVV
jgi:tRNA A-37 threonylcarbamoyl transferase component Bud32